MPKIAAIVFAVIGFIFWIRVTFFRRPLSEVKTIPTGVSKITYFMVALFFFLGPWFATTGFSKLSLEADREKTWLRTTGEIYAIEETGTSKGRTRYRTEFRFKDLNGIEREGSSETTTGSRPTVGTGVNVIYDPADPGAAEIDDGFFRFGFHIALLIFGLIMTTFSVLSSIQILKIQKLAALAQSPGRGSGTLVRSRRNWLLSLRNYPSYRLIVEYTDLAGRKFTTESEPIWSLDPKDWARTDVPVPLSLHSSDTSKAWVRVQEYFLACQKKVTTK